MLFTVKMASTPFLRDVLRLLDAGEENNFNQHEYWQNRAKQVKAPWLNLSGKATARGCLIDDRLTAAEA